IRKIFAKYKTTLFYLSTITKHQKLSEDFIREFKQNICLDLASKYQKLSPEFMQEFELKPPKHSWFNKTNEQKEFYIKKHTNYEIENGCVIAYKSCRRSGCSWFNSQYYYEVGKEYESNADYNSDIENSFGLSAWTKEKALEYCNEKLFK